MSPVTWPTHQRIREDAELALGSFWPGNASVSGYDLARYCLVLLDEVEKVPALVEALQEPLNSVIHHLDCIDSSDDEIADDDSTDTVRVAAAKIEAGIIREILAAWDETP